MKMFLQLITGKNRLAFFAGTVLALMMISTGYAQTYNLPITGTDAVRCGAGEVTLTIGWSGEALNPENVKWYTQPFYGAPFHTGLSYTTDYLERTTPFYVDYIGEGGCSQCDRLLVRAVIADITITPQVIYPSLTYCNSSNAIYAPSIVGAESGIFSVNNEALEVNPGTGAINPFNVPAGSYTVTFIPEAITGCDANPVTVNLVVTNAPVQPQISYPLSSYCSSSAAILISQTGAGGGTYSSSPSGLSINGSTGTITPATSQTGTYTVTYLVPGGGGCSPVSATTTVSILKLPTATIAYSSPFTQNQGIQPVALTGTDDYLGGAFSSTEGLTINETTGEINPSTSTAGNYTVTYTKSAVSPCFDNLIATTAVSIFGLPTAQIDVIGQPVCLGGTDPEITFIGSVGTSPYTFYFTINDGATQNISTAPEANTVTLAHPSLIAGTFVYKILSVTDGNNSTRSYGIGSEPFVTFHVNIQSHGSFDYADSPYCNDGSNPVPTMLDGGVKGSFTSTPGLVFVDAATGEIDISASIPGTYAVTNTIAASGGCPGSTTIVDVTITALPIAGFSYAEAYCNNGTNPTPTLNEGGQIGIFSVTPPGLVFVSLTTGEIDLASSVPGTYTINNTVAAGNGCGVVTASDEVTIEPLPVVTNDEELFICSNSSPAIELTSNLASTFTWTIGNITGDITGAEAGSGNIIDQVLINSSNTETGTVEYIIVPTSIAAGCTGDAFTITVTVKPLPVLASILTPTAICSDLTFEYEATSDATGATFSWSREAIAGILQGTSSGYTATISEVLTNTSNAPINVVYEYTITADGCSSTQNVTVAVNPTPSITNTVLAQAICSGGTTTAVTLNSDIIGATLSWIAYPSAGITGHTEIGTGTIPAQTLSNSLTTDGTVTYVIAPTLGNCYGAEAEYVVIVFALPVCEINGPETVTYGDETEFTAPAGMTTYAWSITGDGSIVGANNQQTVDVSADATGSYTLSLTIYNNNGCTSLCNKVVTVNPATLTATADNQTKVYGSANPTLTFQYSGWVNGVETIDTPPSIATTVDGTTAVGTHIGAITLSGGEDNNYTFNLVAGNFAVTKAVLTATADNQTKVYGAANPTLTMQYSGWVNGVETIGTPPSIATTVDGTTAVGTHIGAITLSGGEDNNYTFNLVAGNFAVTKAVLTATADNQTKVYGAANPTLTMQYSGWVNGVETIDTPPTIATTVTTTTDVGTHTGAITLSGGEDNNYTFNLVAGNFAVTKAVLTVTADPQTKVYGSANPALTFQYSGFVLGQDATALTASPTANTTVDQNSAVNVYTDAITVSGGVSSNYDFTYVPNNFTVTAQPLEIRADDKVKGVGDVDPEFTVTYTGFVGDDNAGSLDGTLSVTREPGETVGTYTITASGLTSGNYTITYQTGTLTIAEVIVEATLGTARAAYNTLDGTFTAINNGVHKGVITISVYADTTEPEGGATLAPSGTGEADYTSVSIVPENNVTINGKVTLGSVVD